VGRSLALSVAAGAAQDPQRKQVFRAGANTVPVYVTVHDRGGVFVTDLTQEDFEVRDDGKTQEITQFTTDAQPLSTLVLIDGSSSMMPVFKSVVEAANDFVLRMLPADPHRDRELRRSISDAPAVHVGSRRAARTLARRIQLAHRPETRFGRASSRRARRQPRDQPARRPRDHRRLERDESLPAGIRGPARRA
jgi:hypothetical protein